MIIRIKKTFTSNILTRSVIYLFILLTMMNFLNQYYYWICAAFLIFLFAFKPRVVIDASTFWLIGMSIAMSIIAVRDTMNMTDIIKPLTFVMAYIIGLNIINTRDTVEKSVQRFRQIILLVAAGTFIHFFLNMATNQFSLVRNTIDIWTKTMCSATAQATLACVCIGLAIAVLFSNYTIKRKILAMFVLAVILLYNLILAGRTLIVLIFIVCAVALIYRCTIYKRKILPILFSVLGLVVLFVFLYSMNVANFRTMIQQSNFYMRFFGDYAENIMQDSRMEYKKIYLENLLKYPFGGSNIRHMYGQYSHDLYLDSYDEFGAPAVVGLIGFMILSWGRLIKCMKTRALAFNVKQLVLCVYFVINVQFFIEPIIQGATWLFCAYCIIDGCLGAVLRKSAAQAELPTMDPT